jgi:hypothetical protein
VELPLRQSKLRGAVQAFRRRWVQDLQERAMNIHKAHGLLVLFFIAGAVASDSLTNMPDVKMLFHANGQVTLGAQIYGKPRFEDLGPGYRSDIAVNTELFGYKDLIFDFLTAASTSIARLPETPVKLDKIRYTLTPELRYEFRKSLVTGSLFHECIHTLSRAEDTAGSTWWNVVQVGMGTKGAYSFYFIRRYDNRDFALRNSFDASINAGYYLHGHAALIGHNHEYAYDLSGLIRYHFGLFRNQTFFIDLTHHTWLDKNSKYTFKLTGEIDYVILAFDNIATLFYSHCFIDENPYDNENSLGTIGFKIIF